MRVIYFSTTLPIDLYNRAVKDDDKTDQQSQKFNRALMRGFVQNDVEVVAISRRCNVDVGISIIIENGIKYICFPHQSAKLLGYLDAAKDCERYLVDYSLLDEETFIFSDVLNISLAYSALRSAKHSKTKAIGIVTDVPGIYNSGVMAKINRFLLKQFDEYVYLTEQMHVLLNGQKKPHVVVEGVCDTSFSEDLETKYDKFVILYAGALDNKFGIDELLDEYLKIKDSRAELHLFGAGDCVDRIKKLSKDRADIVYYGVRNNEEVVIAEKRASLLINPRSKDEEFTKYSFPSKTIEYMATGTPVLMQPLPGMPIEYHKYVLLYNDGKCEALSERIQGIMNCSNDELQSFGKAAMQFVLSKKCEKQQARRIIEELGLYNE